MGRKHKRDGVCACETFKLRAVCVLVDGMNLVVADDHLLHDDFGMPFCDILHQLSGALEEEVHVRFIGSVPEGFGLLSGGYVVSLVRDAGFRRFDAIHNCGVYGAVIKLVDKSRPLFVVLVGRDREAAVEQGAKQGEFPSIYVEFMFFFFCHGELGLLGACPLQSFFRLFSNPFYVFHISDLLS